MAGGDEVGDGSFSFREDGFGRAREWRVPVGHVLGEELIGASLGSEGSEEIALFQMDGLRGREISEARIGAPYDSASAAVASRLKALLLWKPMGFGSQNVCESGSCDRSYRVVGG